MPDPPHCARCNKAVEDAWQICPFCEVVLKGYARGSRGGIAHELLEWAEGRLDRLWFYFVTLIGGCVVTIGGILVAPSVGDALLGKVGIIVMVMLAVGLIIGVVVGMTRDSYKGRFLRMGILIALFLVGSITLLSCVVGIVMIGFVRMP